MSHSASDFSPLDEEQSGVFFLLGLALQDGESDPKALDEKSWQLLADGVMSIHNQALLYAQYLHHCPELDPDEAEQVIQQLQDAQQALADLLGPSFSRRAKKSGS